MAAVTLKASALDSIALAVIDNPPVNTIDASVREGLRALLQQLAARNDIRALVLCCDGSTFCSGADIKEFNGPPKEQEYREIFAAIEALPIPVIAALHGTALGGGLELALACHYRIASADARMGLPEVTLGIIPGGGGTQRLPRLIGVAATLDLILSARPVDAGAALALGIIDEVAEGTVRDAGVAMAQRLLQQGRGLRRTGALSVDPATATDEVIARAQAAAAKQYPNRTAALRAIEAVQAAARLPFEQGLDLECRIVNECKATTESKALVHVFFAERDTRKVPGMSAGVQASPVRSAGIVGSGTMGGGIAIAFANVGIAVTLVDATQVALDHGLAVIDKTYESMVKRSRLTAEQKQQRLGLIRGTLDYADLAQVDVVIEAVFEDLSLKQRIFRQLDAIVKPGAVLATNTSTLDVSEIAHATRRPQDVVGLHFFSPANVMPLLEVVRTPQTSDGVIRTVLELAKSIRKTPVLARVCYGFIGNRMMEGYAREAERLVLEGEMPRRVDGVLERFGMAMGILAVFDMAGVDVGVNVHRANAHRYPPDPSYYQADAALFEAGRLGQKNGKGYYRYEAGDRTRHDDPEAIELLRARSQALNIAPHTHDDTTILERCLYPLLNEGLRILDEGVAMRASDIDVVWTSGYGFPRYRGGPMFYADTIGLPSLLAGMRKYQAEFGPMHWTPAPLLERLVAEGKTIADWERSRTS